MSQRQLLVLYDSVVINPRTPLLFFLESGTSPSLWVRIYFKVQNNDVKWLGEFPVSGDTRDKCHIN